jgi:hypothetical protein
LDRHEVGSVRFQECFSSLPEKPNSTSGLEVGQGRPVPGGNHEYVPKHLSRENRDGREAVARTPPKRPDTYEREVQRGVTDGLEGIHRSGAWRILVVHELDVDIRGDEQIEYVGRS